MLNFNLKKRTVLYHIRIDSTHVIHWFYLKTNLFVFIHLSKLNKNKVTPLSNYFLTLGDLLG